MIRLSIFHWLVGVVAVEVAVGVALVGPSHFRGVRRHLLGRLRRSAPYIVVLVASAGAASAVRRTTATVSWLVGVNVTPLIHAVEGGAVATVQTVASPPVTAFLAFVYVYGFPFLLVFPVLLYLAVDDPRPLRELALALVFNDLIALVAFATMISYGPRNVIPGLVDPILFSTYPEARVLNASATANSNVFPSMHTSLSVTVAYMAWRTRGTVRNWPLVAVPLSSCVVVATMYLGIHWVLDVVAGVILGVGSVWLAARAVEREALPGLVTTVAGRLGRRSC